MYTIQYIKIYNNNNKLGLVFCNFLQLTNVNKDKDPMLQSSDQLGQPRALAGYSIATV